MAERPTAPKGLAISIGICAVLLGISGVQKASAQGTEQERAACRHDVRRFCQAELQRNPGDVLSVSNCLQANRSRLGPTCRAVFVSHGQ